MFKEYKMKKIKLYSVGNQGKFNHYEFDKKQEVIEFLINLFNQIFEIPWVLEETYIDEKDKVKTKKINFEKIKDIYRNYWNSKARIDVVLGDKKIFVILYCSQKLRLKFNEELGKVSYMPKPKESFKVKKEVRKRKKELIDKIKGLSKAKIDKLFFLCDWKDEERGKNKALPDWRIQKIKKGDKKFLETFIEETEIEEVEKEMKKLK